VSCLVPMYQSEVRIVLSFRESDICLTVFLPSSVHPKQFVVSSLVSINLLVSLFSSLCNIIFRCAHVMPAHFAYSHYRRIACRYRIKLYQKPTKSLFMEGKCISDFISPALSLLFRYASAARSQLRLYLGILNHCH
jgi:hypothetical protein